MSLLINPRNDVDSRTQRRTPQRSPNKEVALVAGVPLLLRLPDLNGDSSKRRKKIEPRVAKLPQAGSASKPNAKAAGNTPAATSTLGAPSAPASAGAAASAWRSGVWQLLALILLPVLFLVAWLVLSRTGQDDAQPKDDENIASPTVEMGQPAPPESIVSAQGAPAPSSTPIAESQADVAAPAALTPSPAVESATPITPADGQSAANAAAPPLLSNSAVGHSPNTPFTPADGGWNTPAQQSNNPAQQSNNAAQQSNNAAQPWNNAAQPWEHVATPPQSPAGSSPAGSPPVSAYPSTDPNTYQYPEAPSARVGQRPSEYAFPYPSTGAPPVFGGLGGQSPGAQRR
jgi:hypothetical protein